MNHNLTAEQVLTCLIETIETDLTELVGAEHDSEFVVGEKYAYIECLEVICNWKKAKQFGLDYNPELRYNMK